MEEEALSTVRFDELPSAEDFASQIESRNVPAVFHGCVKDWEAFSKWNPSNGGLDYLQERVGSSVVEAMLSRSAPVFYGDIRSHEMVPLPFSTFITSCKRLQTSADGYVVSVESDHLLTESNADESCLPSAGSSHQVYLAQVPIMNMENKERSQLETLREDVQMPKILEAKTLASINLWMNNAKSRSSTHYDPHHNLLCIVAGSKKDKPDFSTHSRARSSNLYSQEVFLQAGDALFIPEGWFHQVDSDDLTIAVNFWWQSTIISSIPEHMDAYYLRRMLRRLLDNEMATDVHDKRREEISDGRGKAGCHEPGMNEGLEGTKQKHNILMHQLEPFALQTLHDLVSLVHDGMSVGNQHTTLTGDTTLKADGEHKNFTLSSSFRLEDDPIANIIWTLEPLTLHNILLAMVRSFPRTVEALVLHMLSPVTAEALTRKFEEMDQLTSKEDRSEFYLEFYGVFDDQFATMDAILNAKESFARQAFRNVLDKYLGVSFDGENLSIP